MAVQWMGVSGLTGIAHAEDPDTPSAVPISANDDDATVIPDGPSVPVQLTAPGQVARYSFEGQRDQMVSVQLTDFMINRCRLSLVLLNPAGTRLATNAFCAGDLLVRQTLPADGTYTLVVSVGERLTAQANLTLRTEQS